MKIADTNHNNLQTIWLRKLFRTKFRTKQEKEGSSISNAQYSRTRELIKTYEGLQLLIWPRKNKQEVYNTARKREIGLRRSNRATDYNIIHHHQSHYLQDAFRTLIIVIFGHILLAVVIKGSLQEIIVLQIFPIMMIIYKIRTCSQKGCSQMGSATYQSNGKNFWQLCGSNICQQIEEESKFMEYISHKNKDELINTMQQGQTLII